MTKEYIIEGSKTIANYLGYEYVPFSKNLTYKAGYYKYYKYICRTHSDLRFVNCWDDLMPVIEKLEKEFTNIHFELLFGGCTLMCKNSNEYFIDSFNKDLSWIQNTFITVVETIRKLKL